MKWCSDAICYESLSVTMLYDRQTASMRKYEILEKRVMYIKKNLDITINEN